MSNLLEESQYGHRAKQVLSLVKKMQAVGASAELDIPRVAVIGNQSAGKSSVVEAISGISVPRDAGTCTRCPMECRLSQISGDEEWSCYVSIRVEYDNKNKRQPATQVFEFGDRIHDRSLVEPLLRRAQFAILNPSISPEDVLNYSDEVFRQHAEAKASTSLKFSRNVVCVDLRGPELTDLSFIDLPGLIQNAEPEEVSMVEEMVSSHIKGHCLILVALPMTDDLENQKALRLANLEDPEGKRTIGVLTKADMLGKGQQKALQLWTDVIEGRGAYPLEHGYYVTRQPDDAERAEGITTEGSRAAETAFFARTAPWNGSSYGHRFGIQNLTATLSGLLVGLINDSLPGLLTSTQKNLEACRESLASLPAPITAEPANHMLNLVTSFCSHVNKYAEGGPRTGTLVHQNNEAFGDFKKDIMRTAPNFVPVLNKGERPSGFKNVLEEDDDEEGVVATLIGRSEPVYLENMREHIVNAKMRELPGSMPFSAKASLIESFQKRWDTIAVRCLERVNKTMFLILAKCVKLGFNRHEQLQTHIRSYIGELVRKHYAICAFGVEDVLNIEKMPFTQNSHYFQTCTDKWKAKYTDTRAQSLKQKVARPIFAPVPLPAPAPSNNAGSFHAFGTSNTAAFESNPFGSFTSAKSSEPVVFGGGSAFGQARGPPFTSVFSVTPAAQPAPQPTTPRAMTPPHLPSPTEYTDDHPDVIAALAALAKIGRSVRTLEDLGRLNEPDIYEAEMQLMAEVRGYFQVSYKRVIDYVPAMIDMKFVRAIDRELLPFLNEKLGLGSSTASERCAKYLAEDRGVVEKREQLVAKRKRLETVEMELYNFTM